MWAGGAVLLAVRLAVRFAAVVGLMSLAAACADGAGSTRQYTLDTVAGSPARSKTPSPLVRGPLPAGIYFTSRFEPALTFELGKGWRLDSESRQALWLVHGGPEGEITIIVSRSSALRIESDPYYRGVDVVGRRYRAVRGSVLDEIRHLDGVAVEPGPTLEILDAHTEFSVARSTVAGDPSDPCAAEVPCPTVLDSGLTGSWYLAPQEAVLITDAPGADLNILIGGVPPNLEAMAAVAEPVLASISRTE